MYHLLFSTIKFAAGKEAVTEPEETEGSTIDSLVDTHDSNLALLECLSKPSGGRPALPAELVLQILDHPSRWRLISANFESCTLSSPTSVTAHAESIDVASTPPFTARQVSLLRKLAFTFQSKDQGWSSYPDDRGTFRNSWTWFEARVEKPVRTGSTVSQEVGDDEEGMSAGHNQRLRLQANRHAGDELEEYRIEYGLSKDMVRSLQPGDRVILSAHAQFGGWVNFVNQAAIEIWCVDSLDEGSNDNV